MCIVFVSYSQPIRFDGQSVNRGLTVLDQTRALDPCHRPEGSWALGTRMPSQRPRGKSKFGFERTEVSKFESKRRVGSGKEPLDYTRAPCLGAYQKERGLWERD